MKALLKNSIPWIFFFIDKPLTWLRSPDKKGYGLTLGQGLLGFAVVFIAAFGIWLTSTQVQIVNFTAMIWIVGIAAEKFAIWTASSSVTSDAVAKENRLSWLDSAIMAFSFLVCSCLVFIALDIYLLLGTK